MTIEVRVPQLPESVADATLVAWHKQPGDSVGRDENLVDLETDKVVLEVPAPAAGVIVELKVQNGATVTSGQLLALLEEGATASAATPKAAATAATAATAMAARRMANGATSSAATRLRQPTAPAMPSRERRKAAATPARRPTSRRERAKLSRRRKAGDPRLFLSGRQPIALALACQGDRPRFSWRAAPGPCRQMTDFPSRR